MLLYTLWCYRWPSALDMASACSHLVVLPEWAQRAYVPFVCNRCASGYDDISSWLKTYKPVRHPVKHIHPNRFRFSSPCTGCGAVFTLILAFSLFQFKMSFFSSPAAHVSTSSFMFCAKLTTLQGSSIGVDVDMADSARRPSDRRLPPELLAYAFGFLPDLVTCPIAMTHTALSVTHVSSYFRAVGIHLQPRLWIRLPLHSLDLTKLFYGRSGCFPLEIIWTDRLDWRSANLAVTFTSLLHPEILPRVRVLELVAPETDDDEFEIRKQYRRVLARLFRFVLPDPAESKQWVSLERFRVDGIPEDVANTDEEDIDEDVFDEEDIDNVYPEGSLALLRSLEKNDLPSLPDTFPRLTSLTISNLYSPTLRVFESVARYGEQIRSLTFTNLHRVPFYRLAECLGFHMQNLEFLELRDTSLELTPDMWCGDIDLPKLRTLRIKTLDPFLVGGVLVWFYMPRAVLELSIDVRGRYVRFFWNIAQKPWCFTHEPLEQILGEPITDERRAALKEIMSKTVQELEEWVIPDAEGVNMYDTDGSQDGMDVE
ncbi:hypothetical protein PENSPDRAFT_181310 [Peniophora sp. CONT]|nr:hypothetical protein PENSPDRAFT_181310 [Peniophora sp. CONT]